VGGFEQAYNAPSRPSIPKTMLVVATGLTQAPNDKETGQNRCWKTLGGAKPKRLGKSHWPDRRTPAFAARRNITACENGRHRPADRRGKKRIIIPTGAKRPQRNRRLRRRNATPPPDDGASLEDEKPGRALYALRKQNRGNRSSESSSQFMEFFVSFSLRGPDEGPPANGTFGLPRLELENAWAVFASFRSDKALENIQKNREVQPKKPRKRPRSFNYPPSGPSASPDRLLEHQAAGDK
jgi:hypothetical protein